jgi:F-type H+-transporting ATPase subunit b
MQLNWLTFTLELVNFVALTWVLKRILYRPVRTAILDRQARARALLDDADKLRAEAVALEARNTEQLAVWKQGEASRQAGLERDIAEERARRLGRLEEELRAEREAEAVARARRVSEERDRMEIEAVHLAASFAAHLLAELAGPELHRRILDRFVEALPTVPAELLLPRSEAATVEVRTAYPLDAADRERLERAFAELLHAAVHLDVRDAPELIAGVEAKVGGSALEANVEQELSFFANTSHG